MSLINRKNISKIFSLESTIPINLYLFSSPFIIVVSAFAEASINNFYIWILVSALSILVTFLYAIFFKYVILIATKHNRVTLIRIFIYILGLGLVKGISTYYISVIFQLHNHDEDLELFNLHLWKRVIPAIAFAFWYVPAMSWIHYTFVQYKKIRNNLITQAIKLEIENQSYKKLIQESKLTLKKKLQTIFQDIKNELDKIQGEKSFDNEWTKIAQLVRKAAFNEIRPQSHNLWNANIKPYQNLSILYYVQSALKINPFPSKYVVPIFGITSFSFLYFDVLELGTLVAILITLTVFITFSLGKLLNSLSIKNIFINYFIIMALNFSLFGLISNLYLVNILGPDRWFLVTAAIIWLLTLSIATSLMISFQQTSIELFKDIQVSLNAKKMHKEMLKQIERRINTKLAKFLHGNVQARLMSNALQLDMASKNNDQDLAHKELAKLSQDLIDDYGIMTQFDIDIPFNLALQRIKESWEGLCEVEFLGNRLINIDRLVMRDFIEDAIAEAISNAVRHGMADKVKVMFNKISDQKLEISISDNGTGPMQANPGMGAEIFNLLCGKNWQLIPNYNRQGSLLILNIDTSLDEQLSKG